MNYYKRHLGDYAAKAGHLSALEHGVYTLILDAYYNREEGPTRAEAIRIARARSEAEVAAVDAVLGEFFAETDGRYTQQRVEDELAAFRVKQEANRKLGAKGGVANAERNAKRNATQTLSVWEANGEANDKPSHKPLAISKDIPASDDAAPPVAKKPKRETCTLTTFLARCREEGVDAIPEDDPVHAYAERVGLPGDYLLLAWCWFKAKYGPDGSGRAKRYADWRAHFRNAVRDGWPKYWAIGGDGGYYLTTAGKQAQREAANG